MYSTHKLSFAQALSFFHLSVKLSIITYYYINKPLVMDCEDTLFFRSRFMPLLFERLLLKKVARDARSIRRTRSTRNDFPLGFEESVE